MFRNKKVLLMSCIILTMAGVNCSSEAMFGVRRYKPVQLTTPQKRQITTQLIQGSYEDIFSATLTVLQDRNCVIKKTDKTTGLIFAKEEVSSGSPAGEALEEVAMIAQWFLGLDEDEVIPTTDEVTTVKIGCILSKVDSTASQLRINTQEFTLKIKESRRGLLLTKHKEYILTTKPIYDEAYYRKLFTEITVEVKRREAIN